MRQVIFDIADAEDILSEHASALGFAARDDELHAREVRAGECEGFDRGDAGGCGAVDTADAKPEPTAAGGEMERLRATGRDHAVEGAAVRHESHRRAVDLGVDHRTHLVHRHRQFSQFAYRASSLGLRARHSGSDQNDGNGSTNLPHAAPPFELLRRIVLISVQAQLVGGCRRPTLC